MKKTLKFIIATSLVLAMTTMAAFAQSLTASAGTIKDDVDYSMDPRYFQRADFENFLVNGDYNSGLGNNLNVTFAKQINDFYLGTKYTGNFWGRVTSDSSTTPKTDNQYCYNAFDVLFGLKNVDLGIKATTEFKFDKKNENEKTNMYNIGFETGFGAKLSNFELKPLIKFTYKNTKAQAAINNVTTTNTFVGKVGADFVFNEKNGFNSILGIDYNLNLPIAETVSLGAVTNKKIGTVKSFDFNENSYEKVDTVNSLVISYRTNYTVNNKVELGGKAAIINQFNPYKKTDSNNNVTFDGDKFTYELNSNIALGMKYKVVPESFIINTGFGIDFPNVISTTKNNNSTKTKTTTTIFDNDWRTTIYTGFEWNILKNFTLDTSMNFCIQYTGEFTQMFNNLSVGLSYRK